MGKSHFKVEKTEIKRKEFYDSTVRTDDYMRKSGMNRAITLQILLKKKGRKIERDEMCVMMSVSWNFLFGGKKKTACVHFTPEGKILRATFPLLIHITYLHLRGYFLKGGGALKTSK